MFEYISVLDFTNEIEKRTEKLELDLDAELRRTVLSTIFCQHGRLWNHFCNSMLKRRDRNDSILSCYPVPIDKLSI